MRYEPLTAHIDRADADMNDHFQTIFGNEPNHVSGRKSEPNHAVKRSVDFSFLRSNRKTSAVKFTQNIRHFFNVHDLPACWRNQTCHAGVFGIFFSFIRIVLSLRKLSLQLFDDLSVFFLSQFDL